MSLLLGGKAAYLYGFDLDQFAPPAQQYRATVTEIAQWLIKMPDRADHAFRVARMPR